MAINLKSRYLGKTITEGHVGMHNNGCKKHEKNEMNFMPLLYRRDSDSDSRKYMEKFAASTKSASRTKITKYQELERKPKSYNINKENGK